MARARSLFRCTSCGVEHSAWFGQCPSCHAWNSLEEVGAQSRSPRPGAALTSGRGSGPVAISRVAMGQGGEVRFSSGIAEFDRVLGGGLVAGSVTLLGGDPGVGKSTLLLMALAALTKRGVPALYVSGEESDRQIRLRADRLGIQGESLFLLTETDLSVVRDAVASVKARFLVLDSVQVLRCPEVESPPGSVSQIRAVADVALDIAKGKEIATFLIGHVTREGTLAGPKLLEHLVDTVLYFECDGRSPLRLLRATKNRFGATGEIGLFEMGDAGLVEVPDASARLLSERAVDAPGTAVVSAMEGTRPMLTEVQALVGRPVQGTPGRQAVGLERARLNQILAVLDKSGLGVCDRDVYVSAAGGVRIPEPAADLGILAALVSSHRGGPPIPPDVVFFGEVGLAGEIRAVSFPALRLKEAHRHGFKRAMVPPSVTREGCDGLSLVPVRSVRETLGTLVEWGKR
jgi:DNA repair protein RadA/Sms